MMIVQMDKMSAPPSRERAQRLYEKVFIFSLIIMRRYLFFPSLKFGICILVMGLGLSIKLN
jgi:hypothetical protein